MNDGMNDGMNDVVHDGTLVTKIYKYTIPVDDGSHEIKLSRGSEVLFVAHNRKDMHVVDFWATHYPERENVPRRFRVVGTGQPFSASFIHRGTAVSLATSPFVWHLLESL